MRENMNDRVKKGFCLLLTVAVVASMTVVVPLSTAQPSDDSSAPVKGVVKSLKLSKKKVSLESGKKKTVKVKVKTKGPASKKIKVKRTKAAKKVLKKVKVKKPNKKGVSKIKLRAKEVTKQKTVKLKVKTKARNAKGKHIKQKLKVMVKPVDQVTKVIHRSVRLLKAPHVDHIAASGELAVIVQAIGGKGALVAADHELLSSDFMKVFSDEGANNITEGWSDDGATMGSKNTNVDKIIESGAQAILCYDSSYYEELTSEQREDLNDAGIEFVRVNKLSRSKYVKRTVDTIGDMLSSSTVIGEAGNTVSNAKSYADFHDDLVDAVLDANDGKLASADEKTYEGTGESKSATYDYTTDAPYTLLMDGYDSAARFTKPAGAVTLDSDEGVMLSTLGYKSRTTSYYMQVGGVINNAATRFNKGSDGKKMVVWQFGTHQLRFDKDYWDNRSSELNEAYYPNSGKGWQFTLLTTDVNSTASGSEGIEGTMPGSSFGTTTFPTVITTTDSAKNALISNSEKEYGLYHPYDVATFGGFSYFGFVTNSSLIYSCIGADGSKGGNTNVFASSGNKITSDYVKVNPHGLFTSWTEGNSMEAVLECAWINDEVQGNSNKVGWEDEVKEFYKEIYRYDLSSSDFATIEAGLE